MKRIIIVLLTLVAFFMPLSAQNGKVDKKAQLEKQLRHASIMIRYYRYWFSRRSNYRSMTGSYSDGVMLRRWKMQWIKIRKELDKYKRI